MARQPSNFYDGISIIDLLFRSATVDLASHADVVWILLGLRKLQRVKRLVFVYLSLQIPKLLLICLFDFCLYHFFTLTSRKSEWKLKLGFYSVNPLQNCFFLVV